MEWERMESLRRSKNLYNTGKNKYVTTGHIHNHLGRLLRGPARSKENSCMYAYMHKHQHTYICVCMQVSVCVCVGMRYAYAGMPIYQSKHVYLGLHILDQVCMPYLPL